MESRLVYTHKTAIPALTVDCIHRNHAVLSNHALLMRTHANGSICNYCNGPQRVNTIRQRISRANFISAWSDKSNLSTTHAHKIINNNNNVYNRAGVKVWRSKVHHSCAPGVEVCTIYPVQILTPRAPTVAP